MTDRIGRPVTVDPDRHDDDGQAQTVQDPRGDVGPEAPASADGRPEPKGPIERFLEKLLGMAEPKPRPDVIMLSGDEQAHRLVSDEALVALAAAVDRFLVQTPQRVETVPSDAFSAEQTRVNTTTPAQRLVGRQPTRLRVTITNRDAANSIFIGSSLEVTTATGYEIAAGESLTLETRAPVYAIAETAAVTVGLLTEFGEGS